MNQHIRYHQIWIKCQYMSNICQAQTKGKWDNETNKREQKKGPRGVSKSKGLKTSSSRVRRFEDFEHHITSCNIMGCRETDDVSWTRKFFSGFMRGFPLQSPPPIEKHQLDVGGIESRWNGMVPKVSAQICQGVPGSLWDPKGGKSLY